ncbi:unnamed protein product [Urochloa humidicola]
MSTSSRRGSAPPGHAGELCLRSRAAGLPAPSPARSRAARILHRLGGHTAWAQMEARERGRGGSTAARLLALGPPPPPFSRSVATGLLPLGPPSPWIDAATASLPSISTGRSLAEEGARRLIRPPDDRSTRELQRRRTPASRAPAPKIQRRLGH